MANVVKYKKTGDMEMQGAMLLNPLTASNVPNAGSGQKTLFLDTADTTLKTKDSSGTVAAIGGGDFAVEVLGTSGTQTIDRAVSDKFTCEPASATTFDTSNFTDGKKAYLKITNPNSLITFPSSWEWSNTAPTGLQEAGFLYIELTGVNYDSNIIIVANSVFSYTDLSASLMIYLKFDGTDNSTTIVDDTGRHTSFTLIGAAPPNNTRLKTDVKYAGTASVKNTGFGGGIQVASSVDFAFPDLFTIEFYLYPVQNSGDNGLVGITSYTNFEIDQYNAAMRIWINGTNHDTSGDVLTLNTWQKVAVTRNASSVVTLWIGGVSVMTFTDSFSITADVLSILCRRGSAGAFDGYMDEFKIYKGICLYN